MVTSDGGFDCSAEPGKQEEISAELKKAEYTAIISRLEIRGNGILKLFACCHQSTLEILESSSNGFERSYITKPASSKAGNSEIYLVMIGFRGEEAARLGPNTHSYLTHILPTVTHFIQRQITAIQLNLDWAPKLNDQTDIVTQQAADTQYEKWRLKGIGFSLLKFLSQKKRNKLDDVFIN